MYPMHKALILNFTLEVGTACSEAVSNYKGRVNAIFIAVQKVIDAGLLIEIKRPSRMLDWSGAL